MPAQRLGGVAATRCGSLGDRQRSLILHARAQLPVDANTTTPERSFTADGNRVPPHRCGPRIRPAALDTRMNARPITAAATTLAKKNLLLQARNIGGWR
jgi:hypothetical protein